MGDQENVSKRILLIRRLRVKTFDFDRIISIFFLGLEDKATEIKVCSSLV